MDYNNKYLKYKQKYLQLKKQLNKNIMTGGGNSDKTIYLFKAEWCPHCKMFKPVWNNLQDKLKNKIKFITYDSDKDAEQIKQYNIEGYPTIILQAGGKAIEYVGPRDESSLIEFINQY